jgi:ABC-type glycerol-3-phosphate transport system substrate-binding protein
MSTSLAARLAMLAAGTAALTACGGRNPGTPATSNAASPALDTCTIYAEQDDAQIIVSPGIRPSATS